MRDNNNITYFDEEELFKILLTCYCNFIDEEENGKANEIMDVFDNMMLNSYSNRVEIVLKKN